MTDDLDAPLGRKKKAKLNLTALRERLPHFPWGRIMAASLVLLFGIAIGRIILVDDPDGGRPTASVTINTTKDNNTIAQSALDDTPPSTIISEQGATSFEIVSADGDTPDANQPNLLPDAPMTNEFDLFPDLLEETKYGAIPRISPQGQSPFNAYARPSVSAQSAGGKPLIAIVVTGLGLNDASTIDAVDRLPDNVTLAFAPYGPTLERATLAARRQGHEILLEIPMEPFDYPQSDPGPHTLLTEQPARTNLDHLFWLMSRFGGYVGVMNNLGARFSSSAADFTPIMEELGTRGLGYFDDNSSNRSLSRQLANANKVPFARASIALDNNPSRAAILEQLTALENLAQQNGSAVGLVNALPISISSITSWAADLQDRNFELVPLSALMD